MGEKTRQREALEMIDSLLGGLRFATRLIAEGENAISDELERLKRLRGTIMMRHVERLLPDLSAHTKVMLGTEPLTRGTFQIKIHATIEEVIRAEPTPAEGALAFIGHRRSQAKVRHYAAIVNAHLPIWQDFLFEHLESAVASSDELRAIREIDIEVLALRERRSAAYLAMQKIERRYGALNRLAGVLEDTSAPHSVIAHLSNNLRALEQMKRELMDPPHSLENTVMSWVEWVVADLKHEFGLHAVV